MKKIIIFIGLFIAFGYAQAQYELTDLLENLKEEYDAQQISLSGNMLKFESNGTERSIDKFMLNIFSDNQMPDKLNHKILSTARKSGFEELVVVADKDADVNIMIRESKDIIKALLILVNSDDEDICIYAEGKFKLEDLEDLDLDIEGLDYLRS